MQHLVFPLIIAGLLLSATSCTTKKAEDVNPITNKWTVGADEFTPVSLTDTLNSITASTGIGSTSSSITFLFTGDTLPRNGGRYRIVGSLAPDDKELSFVTAGNNAGSAISYAASGRDSLFATVSVSGAKVTVKMPAARAKNILNPKDSLQVSANIQQF